MLTIPTWGQTVQIVATASIMMKMDMITLMIVMMVLFYQSRGNQ